jgi:hypothetical protein
VPVGPRNEEVPEDFRRTGPEDGPQEEPGPRPVLQNELLQFRDITLEAKYAIYINKLLEPQDLYWTLLFFLLCPASVYFAGDLLPLSVWEMECVRMCAMYIHC